MYGVAGRCAALRSMLAQYSEGVITFSAFRRFAICVGPRPSIHILKMRRTTSAAGSSISHLISGFFASGSFIYPKGGTVVSGKPDIPLLRNTLRTFWLVFLACHSLNQSCIGTISLTPLAVSILSIMAIYRTPRRSNSSSMSCPTIRRLRPSLE